MKLILQNKGALITGGSRGIGAVMSLISLAWLWRTGIAAGLLLLVMVSVVEAQDDPFIHHKPPPVVGRWDITVRGVDREYPSWLEVRQSGYRTLVGSYVGRFGSARPISHIEYDHGRVRFTLPPPVGASYGQRELRRNAGRRCAARRDDG